MIIDKSIKIDLDKWTSIVNNMSVISKSSNPDSFMKEYFKAFLLKHPERSKYLKRVVVNIFPRYLNILDKMLVLL